MVVFIVKYSDTCHDATELVTERRLNLKTIKSFLVDHTKLNEGIYISRVDGDCVTYDLRFCKPNTGIILDNPSIHTTEHMIATLIRNSEIADEVVYFGPMGCQTGFYLIVRDVVTSDMVVKILIDCLKKVMAYEGEVFGASEKECGNYRNLDLNMAKRICGVYLEVLKLTDKVKTYEEV